MKCNYWQRSSKPSHQYVINAIFARPNHLFSHHFFNFMFYCRKGKAGIDLWKKARVLFFLTGFTFCFSVACLAQDITPELIRRFDSVSNSLRKTSIITQNSADSLLARILNEATSETAGRIRSFDSAALSLQSFYEQFQARFLVRCGSRDGVTLPEEMMGRTEPTDSFFIHEGNGILVFQRKEALDLWKGPVEDFTPEAWAKLQPKGKALDSHNARMKFKAEYVLTRLPVVSALNLLYRFKNDLQNLRLNAYNEYLRRQINKTQ